MVDLPKGLAGNNDLIIYTFAPITITVVERSFPRYWLTIGDHSM